MFVEFPYPRFILGDGDREKHSSLPEEIHSFVGPILFFILGVYMRTKQSSGLKAAPILVGETTS